MPATDELLSDSTPELNPQQRAAVEEQRSVLVLSGAGTGKTRVITARIAHLLKQGVAPGEILAVTFTNKAAGEMKARIGSPGAVRSMYVGTFHALCARLLRMHPSEAGLPANFRILDGGDQLAMIRRILKEDLGLPAQAAGGPDPREVRFAIAQLKESGLRSGDVTNKQAELLVRDAYASYERRLRDEEKADFTELILRCCEMLRESPAVAREWGERFRHVLVDELQDISRMQMEWIGLLRTRRTVHFGVGDDDQSIYAFRGADPSLMNHFMREFANGNVLRLERNYRSCGNILALANGLIADNSDRIGKKLVGSGSKGAKPSLSQHPTDEDEARSIARAIRSLADEGVGMDSIAIFYRNHALSQVIEQQLQHHHVDYRIRGSQRFFERPEVRAIISYLAVANNPQDDAAIIATINAPPRGAGPAMIARLRDAAAGGPLCKVLEGDVSPKIKDYWSSIQAIRSAAKRGIEAAAEAAASKSGLIEYYSSKGPREKERIGHIEEVVSAAARFAKSDGDSLSEFLAYASLEGDAGGGQAAAEVSLMTIHAAKGLEFDNVFVAGIEDGILPPHGAFNEPRVLCEERRLLYVAITRARKTLALSCAQMRRVRGSFRPMKPSSLLMRLPNGLFDQHGFRAPRTRLEHQEPAAPPRDRARNSAGGLQVGQKIRHGRFGPGVVLGFAGEGEQAKVHVQFFAERTRKWLILRLAKLQPQ